MNSAEGPDLETLRVLARQAGLDLTEEELQDVLPGVRRNLSMAKTVRKWAGRDVEPAVAPLPHPDSQA